MIKGFRKYIPLSIIIFILITFSSISIYAWDNCPFGLENDPYPGECKRYIDTDGDGICDRSQPVPEDHNTTIASNEENIKENTKDDDKYPKEMDEKVTGGFFLAEAASPQKTISNSPSPERKSLPDYNFLEIFFITLLIYFGGKSLAQKLKASLGQERKFWNTLLLISFLGSAGTGMILVFIRDFEWFKSINFNFLFWHVEFSILMALLSVIHALWHLKYYLSIFGQKTKKNNTYSSKK